MISDAPISKGSTMRLAFPDMQTRASTRFTFAESFNMRPQVRRTRFPYARPLLSWMPIWFSRRNPRPRSSSTGWRKPTLARTSRTGSSLSGSKAFAGGPGKFDVFFGQLAGNEFPPRPLIHGEKISFKPTPNLELGFSRTVEMGGVGRPLTLRALWNSYTSVTSSKNETPASDPGKRTGGFDFSYRVPFVRNWVTVYADSLADDDPSPLAAPQRAGINSGIYFPRIPGAPKLELRVEAVYTDAPTPVSFRGQYIYFDTFYHDLYTNKKNIIGSWIGREGQGLQAWSKYSFNARNSLQFGYRHAKVSSDFIPGGGTLNDASVQADFLAGRELGLSSRVQYEHWNYPILAPQPQTNISVSVQMTYWPHLHVK